MSPPDVNAHSFADMKGIHVVGVTYDAGGEAEPGRIADVLKCSNLQDSSFTGCTVLAWEARENAVDCNRHCRNIAFLDMQLYGGQQCAVVVKGGCENIAFTNVEIIPKHGAAYHILWDDWSDQSRKPSTGLLDNVRVPSGPVKIVFGRFRLPKRINGNYRVLWCRSIGLHFYNLGKGILRTLKIV